MTNLGPTPYDAAGNQTMYSPYTLTYDAENPAGLDDEPEQRVRHVSVRWETAGV